MRMLLPLLLGFLTLVPPAQAAGERLTSRPRPASVVVKPLAVGDEVRTETGQRRRVVLPDGSILYVNQQTSLKVKAARQVSLDKGEVFVEVGANGKDEGDFTLHTSARAISARAGSFALRADERGTRVLVTRGKVKVSDVETPLGAGQVLASAGKQAEAAPRGSQLLDWTRELMIAAEPRLVPQSEHCGGALVANTPAGEPVKLSLRKFHIDVFIEDGFARTTIDQTYFNHHTARLEGTFYFPLPADASLSQLAMYVGENLMEGGMVERDYGRAVYERIVHSQQDPALLEWLDGTTFKMRVFPLEARQEKRVLLSYTQKLASFQGRLQYRFPAGHNLDAVNDWSLGVRVKSGAKLTWKSASHTLTARTEKTDLLLSASEKNVKLDKDVVLDVEEEAGDKAAARFSLMEQDGAKYLMVRYRPQWPATPRRERRDWVVLFEASGDRNPLLARTQIEIVRGLLQQAEPDDTVTVATAATRLTLWNKQAALATPENIAAALTWLENAHLLGALDLHGALTALEPVLKARQNPHLIHVGTGIPALGDRRQDVLLKQLPQGSRYVGIGVGKRWNRTLMKAAAEQTGGFFTQINPDESLSWRTFELSATLNTPRLLNVSVADSGGKNRWLTLTTLLSQGEELCAVTRLDDKDALPAQIVIRGLLDDRAVEIKQAIEGVTPEASYLPRHWARLEIEQLLPNADEKTRARIIELSKAMYVMTPFTSLLVLENDDMYTQYKVERNRKDLWAAYPAPKKIKVVVEGEVPSGKPTRAQILATIVQRGQPLVFDQRRSERQQEEKAKAMSSTPEFTSDGEMLYLATPTGITEVFDASGSLDFSPRTGRSSGIQRRKDLEELGLVVDRPHLRAVSVKAKDQAKFALDDARDLRSFGVRGTRREEELKRFSLAEEDGPVSGTSFDPQMLGDGREDLVSAQLATKKRPHPAEPAPIRMLMDLEKNLEKLEVNDIRQSGEMATLLYGSLRHRSNDRLFYDLLLYAPGLDTGMVDVLAVVENEALESAGSKAGTLDAKALALFAQARQHGWQAVTLPTQGEIPAFTIVFDAAGRYSYERILPPGIKEQVICDGKTIWHLYPELQLGARRSVSRFHRIALASLIARFLPAAEDLARGADLQLIDDRTAALVPHGAGNKDKDGKVLPYTIVQFVFADGHLSERQMIAMPDKKLLRREVYGKDEVRRLDGAGKELSKSELRLTEAKEPTLKPKLDGLVMLDLPYRTPEHVRKATKTEKKGLGELTFAEGLPLLAAYVARGNADQAAQVYQEVFANRDQRHLGFQVLLAACGRNLDSQHGNILNDHRHEPLAQYLALYSSPLLREHASQWATNSGQWQNNFMHRLAVTHSLLQRWQTVRTLGATDAARLEEAARAGEFIRTYPDSPFAWALWTLMIDRTQEMERDNKNVKAYWETLTGLGALLSKKPGVRLFARYEYARALWKTGKTEQAVKVWRDLYEENRADGNLLRIDSDFRTAFQGVAKGQPGWNELLADTAKQMRTTKQRGALITFAWQLWQLDDSIGAGELVQQAQSDIKDETERENLQRLALQFYWQTSQHELADQQLRIMLADKKQSEDVQLWQLAAELAGQRSQPRRVLECLEKAATLVARQAEKADPTLQQGLNQQLLALYSRQAEALLTLQIEPPADFRAKVIQAADRWRAGEQNTASACQQAAGILRTLGERDLAWDYLTTPVAERPYEAGPWVSLAQQLVESGELVLADRAFASAFDVERTNAQILWDRAQALRQGGKTTEAKTILRQLAEGSWQPRFRNLQEQAKAELER